MGVGGRGGGGEGGYSELERMLRAFFNVSCLVELCRLSPLIKLPKRFWPSIKVQEMITALNVHF